MSRNRYDNGAREDYYRDRAADDRAEALHSEGPDYDPRVNGGELVDPYTGQPIDPSLRYER